MGAIRHNHDGTTAYIISGWTGRNSAGVPAFPTIDYFLLNVHTELESGMHGINVHVNFPSHSSIRFEGLYTYRNEQMPAFPILFQTVSQFSETVVFSGIYVHQSWSCASPSLAYYILPLPCPKLIT
jgi:hypothetical protein